MNLGSVHVNRFGSFGERLISDMEGYVHFTPEAVIQGTWQSSPSSDSTAEWDALTEEWALEVADHNRRHLDAVEDSITAWQQGGLS